MFITTPRGLNHAASMFDAARNDPDWYCEILPATKTGVFSDVTLERERRELIDLFGDEEGDARFRQEYLCDFTAAMPGAYYGRLMTRAQDEGRITKVPHDPAKLVETWWDLGISDATAVWFVQRVGAAVHLIDYFEASGEGLPFYAKMLKERAAECGYLYGEHVMPHDTRSRDISVGETRAATLVGLGVQPTIQSTIPLSEKGYRADGIDQVRRMLPRCWFDAERCKRGIAALRQYHREYDEKRQTYQDVPHHDWSSHGCFVGETKVLTRYGTCRIMDLPFNGEVQTTCGWKRYSNPRVTRANARLVEVEFAGGYTVRCTPDHLFLTENGWKSAESLYPGSVILSCSMRSHSILTVAFIGFGRLKGTILGAARSFTEKYGRLLSEIFRAGVTSIIATTSQQTIAFQTLSACLPQKILARSDSGRDLGKLRWTARLSGIGLKQEGYGIAVMRKEPRTGQSGSESRSRAEVAGKSLTRSYGKAGTAKNTVAKHARALRIERVRTLSETSDVWCLTVPDVGQFALANGAIVHNCDAFRIGAMHRPITAAVDEWPGTRRPWNMMEH
ncbi:MAG: hypothetical protein IPK79_01290 [Vampirovibrionales bacterium]|nr:hypothetical protein [Vampirovibrionales bacterium]